MKTRQAAAQRHSSTEHATHKMQASVSKVEAQLAKLEDEMKGKPAKDLPALEAEALKGDTLLERKLAAASLKLQLSQKKLLEARSGKRQAETNTARNEKETPFFWTHTPSADEKAVSGAALSARKTSLSLAAVHSGGKHRRRLLEDGCAYEAYVEVPTSAAFDARVEVLRKTQILLVKKGFDDAAGRGAFSIETSIEDVPPPAPTVRLADCDEDKCCRVEILHEEKWGTVCDDTSKDAAFNVASVACKQAGCDGVGAELKFRFGGGSGDIWLDDVECNGGEEELGDCENSGAWGDGNEDCDHDEDMGVCCPNGCTGPTY